MFERLSNSFALARSSWAVLLHNKKLIVFPVVSGLVCLVVLASFVVPLALLAPDGRAQFLDENNRPAPLTYAVLFAFYFCTWFVIIFCNAALISCALMSFSGQQPTVSDGFRAAAARLPQIVAWALVSATVGLLLKAVEMAHEKVGELVSAILGTAWSITTYFVVPVLVVEKVGPFEAVRRSLALLRKAWGEALVGGFSLALFKFVMLLPGLLLVVFGVVLLVVAEGAAAQAVTGWALIGAGVPLLLLAVAAMSALDSIFLAALYQYAAFERVPEGFDASAMRGAFKGKKATA